jgi:hypothetical protein
MTDLNVHLSATLQTELSQEGAWAYAVYFDSNGLNPVWTSLVSDGAVAGSGSVPIALPTTFISGKVYLIVQSLEPGAPSTLPATITESSMLNWSQATTDNFRFDSIEMTLQNSPFDVVNLTSVNGFGLPMSLVVNYSNATTGTVGYGITGASLVSQIDAIDPAKTYSYNYTAGPLTGTFRMALSPTEAVGGAVSPAPFTAADWNAYVSSLQGAPAANVQVTGQFNGAPDAAKVWHNGGYFSYGLSWDEDENAFWLSPTANSQIKGHIKITPAELTNSIYSTLGNVEVYTAKTDPTPFLSMNTGANNQWGKVLSEFLTGFTGGYYNNSGTSPNDQITTPVALGWNGMWDPIWAFGNNSAAVAPAYMAYDPYSKVFFEHSNSYGSNYSDALMSQYSVGGPLLSVSEPTGAPNAGANVPAIDLTLFADSETPTGYVVPEIFNYIAPPGGAYEVPTGPVAGLNITLNFASAVANNIGVVLPKDASITFSVLKDDAGGVPVWSTVTLNGATAGDAGLWQQWTISYDAGTGQYGAAPSVPAVAMPVGSMLLDAFPVVANGVSWYQVGVGSKTFNLYTSTSGSKFQNPNQPGQAGVLAIDGLATVTPQSSPEPTITTFSVNFAVGDTVTVPDDTLVLNTAAAASLPAPAAPVAGTMSGDTFTALAGQTTMVNSSATSTIAEVAFGWTGLNPNAFPPAPATPWTNAYTNKIDALTMARVTIQPVSGDPIYAEGVADIDGAWRTSPVVLANGSYTVTMLSYAAGDASFTTPLTSPSSVLNLTVDAPPPCFAAGTRIATARGDIPVEALVEGDMVLLAGGGTAPVVWLGHRRVACRRHARPRDVMPVRVRRHAFGHGLPCRDLVLSPDHAVFADGVLIPVRYLVNGGTITQQDVDVVVYHHVELPAHAVLLAEGLPCESYLDTGNRDQFHGGTVEVLHPDFALGVWQAKGCAPLVRDGAQVTAVRRRVLQQARRLGFVTTREAGLVVEAGGQTLALRRDGAVWRATLPAGTGRVVLRSNIWVPAEARVDDHDARRLGVAVARLWLDGAAVALDGMRMERGWQAVEPEWRWTDGAAVLRVDGAREIAIEVAMTGQYWRDAA